MATMRLRTPEDLRRLFSALGDELVHESIMDVTQIDEMAMEGILEDVDWGALYISALVALATGYAAIRGYERNDGSLGWGLGWGALGFLFPVPAAGYTLLKQAA